MRIATEQFENQGAQMLSRQQADHIADEILQQARSDKLSQLALLPSRIPLLYRCRELRALPKWMQGEVIRQATQEVARSPAFYLLLLALILGVGGLWLWMFGATFHVKAPLLMPFLAVPIPWLVRALLMRHRVRLIAVRLHTLWPSSNPAPPG